MPLPREKPLPPSYAPTDPVLASASEDATVRFWHAATGEAIVAATSGEGGDGDAGAAAPMVLKLSAPVSSARCVLPSQP